MRKFICLFLTLALMIMAVPALATTVPSKTTGDLYTIEDYNVPLAGLFTINSTLTADTQADLDAITAYVNGGQGAAGYFGIDAPNLVLSEFVSLDIKDYQATTGNVTATLGFATTYQEGQTVAVMFGYKDADGITVWTQLDATVVNGGLQIVFPSELLQKAGSEAILAVLS